MSISLRILLVLIAILSTYSMLKRIKKFKLQIEYAIFWIVFSAFLVISAIFPEVFNLFSKVLGVYSPANLVFEFIIFVLLIKVFFMTIELSLLETKLKELVQHIALEEKENDAKENSEKKD